MNRRSFMMFAATTAFSIPTLLPSLSFAQEATPSSDGAECVENETDGTCLPIADLEARVDLAKPVFSNPTDITNPRFPISSLTQVLLLGIEAGEQLRVEATLLPETRMVDWDGQQVETVRSQFVAYLDGRVAELAIDYFAQADDGSVWYFGEDVSNYERGVIANTHGTWLAGSDGVPGMIMPANPQVGNVYRPENVPGFVFEEVTVLASGQTIDGPRGRIEGAIVVQELLLDGTYEEKVFAPGYGEFSAKTDDEFLGLALALPIDASAEPAPRALLTLLSGARAMFDAADDEEWDSITATFTEVVIAWEGFGSAAVPPVLDLQMDAALEAADAAIENRASGDLRQAAVNLDRAVLDLHLQYRPVTAVDLDRMALIASQIQIDSKAGEPGDLLSNIVGIELIWNRTMHNVEATAADKIGAAITELRATIDSVDVDATIDVAGQFKEFLTSSSSTS